MSARRAVPRVFLPAIIALNLISFTPLANAQKCRTAHDPKALKTLQEKADAGDSDAQCGLGKQYEFGLGVPQDNKQAVLWLQKSAEQGDVLAQVEIGVVLDKMQDFAQALIWYRKAAEQGNARAEYNLGLAYQNGEAVPKDMAHALVWYRKAADQGDVLAQSNLGVAYEHGVGVQQDYPRAADLYRKAAEQGVAKAQTSLGLLYLNGSGVPKDETQAAVWMLKAAEQGQPVAQFNLGICFLNGAGVDRDLNEGYFWIFLANTRTMDSLLKGYAEDSLDQLTGVMKKNDIKSAQKRAQVWLNQHPPLKFEQDLVQSGETTPPPSPDLK
ncbi:MAG: tetratricopeptide repeat protein [Terracidiphilus sp.]